MLADTLRLQALELPMQFSVLTVALVAGLAAGSAGAGRAISWHASPAGGVRPGAGGKALFVVGAIPLHGTDTQVDAALKAHGLEVELIQEKTATAASATGKSLIVMSYSMLSTTFKAEDFAGLPVPIIVMEHFLLPRLGMTTGAGHGFTPSNLTAITIISGDPVLTAGFPLGDRTVYGKMQEMFWGSPGPGAIKVAAVKGKPDQIAYFAYPKGAMMAGRTAPARRLQFFHATHAPPPVDTLYLNEDGLELLGAAIKWSVK